MSVDPPAFAPGEIAPRHAGRLVAALALDGGARVLAVVADGPADELAARHGLDGNTARLAAEGVVSACLLAAHIKGDERLELNVQGSSPPLALAVEVNGDGTIRGRWRPASMPPFSFFTGLLRVAKSLGPRQLYQGVAEVRGERFERALHRYMAESQQVDARVRVAADVGDDGRVAFAAGLLVERMPHLDPGEFAAVVDRALAVDFKELMAGFAFGQLAGGPVEVLGSQVLRFACTCSEERVHAMLRSLGPAEVASMLEEQGQAEVTCHFCNTRYRVPGERLREML